LLAGRVADLGGYAAAVGRKLVPLTAAGWGAKLAMDRFPRATFACVRLPVTWRVVEKLLLGELGHPGAARGADRAALRLIEALALAGGATGRTDRPGHFRCQGPIPPRYESLPPPSHVRIDVPGYKQLLTRYVVAQGERRGRVRLVLEPDQL